MQRSNILESCLFNFSKLFIHKLTNMKVLSNPFKSLSAILFLSLIHTMVSAQNSTSSSTTKSSSTITTETTTVEPWVWIVGAAVLIIIIVVLVRGKSGTRTESGTTDKVTYTKKVSREDNV